MTTTNEKTPAPGATGNEGMSTYQSRSTAESTRRRRSYHIPVNWPEVQAGRAGTWRFLCGKTCPVGKAETSHTTPAAEHTEWVKCPECDGMERHAAELRREEKALQLARFLLEHLEEKEAGRG